METFLQLALSFPTVVFTTMLLFIVLYWALVLVGALGFDFGDAKSGLLEAKSGALEAKAGMLEAKAGALEAKAGVLEAKSAALEAKSGAIEGKLSALEAKAGALDSKEGIWEALGFGVVPGSIIISFLVFWAWSSSMLGSYFIGPLLGGMLPVWLVGSGVGVLALFASVFLSMFSVKPLKPLFEIQRAPMRRQLLGKVATISSGRVDANFGTATMEDGGAGLLMNVFCSKQNQLKKGDRVLLLEYDEKKEAYEVEPVDFLLPEELKQLDSPVAAEAIARAHAKQRVTG